MRSALSVAGGRSLFKKGDLVPRFAELYTNQYADSLGTYTRASPSGKASASQSSEQENANATKAIHNQIRPVKTPCFRNGRFFMGSRATGTTRVFSESVPCARRSPRTLTPANKGLAKPTPRRAPRSPSRRRAPPPQTWKCGRAEALRGACSLMCASRRKGWDRRRGTIELHTFARVSLFSHVVVRLAVDADSLLQGGGSPEGFPSFLI